MQSSLFIHATNIHQGGGHSLLTAILNALPSEMMVTLSLDSRMSLPEGLTQDIRIKRVRPSIVQRIFAERWLAQNVAIGDVVLCFGNLPPLFKLRGRTIVFLQNRCLIDDVCLSDFPFLVWLRLTVERIWLFRRMKNVDEFVVQTPTMKKLLRKQTKDKIAVRILPFVAKPDMYSRKVSQFTMQDKNDLNFIYVASGETYKNHLRLLEAWRLLAEDGIFPSLHLTLSETRFPELCEIIEVMRQDYELKVINVGELSHENVLNLYKKVDVLIYPSILESFGLPLIEARQAGLFVLASELDYVRDVLDPEQTFDPQSSSSIARAVKRFMGKGEQALPLLNATRFLACLLEKA